MKCKSDYWFGYSSWGLCPRSTLLKGLWWKHSFSDLIDPLNSHLVAPLIQILHLPCEWSQIVLDWHSIWWRIQIIVVIPDFSSSDTTRLMCEVFEWNVSTGIELIFGTNTHVPLRMNCNFADALTFCLVPSKCVQNSNKWETVEQWRGAWATSFDGFTPPHFWDNSYHDNVWPFSVGQSML